MPEDFYTFSLGREESCAFDEFDEDAYLTCPDCKTLMQYDEAGKISSHGDNCNLIKEFLEAN